MTDPKPARRPAAKAAGTKPAAKVAPAKSASAKTPAAKTPASKTPAAKTPAAKVPATKASTAKTPTTRASTARTSAVPPVVPAAVVPAPAAATAAPGWYQVAAGSTQQRWWNGSAWTNDVYDPAPVRPIPTTSSRELKAPEGTSPTTIWFWITAASPIIAIVSLIPTGIAFTQFAGLNLTDATGIGNFYTSPAYLVSTLLGFVELAAYILFPILDWRALGKRGVPKPFHWAWSLIALAVSSPIVYVIGRTVVVKRRTGRGLAPLWVFIALQVIAWVVGLIVIIIFITALFTQFASLLNDSNEVF